MTYYVARESMIAEKEKVDKKLGLAENKLTVLFAEQTIAMAKFNAAQAVARNLLNMAKEVERVALEAENFLANAIAQASILKERLTPHRSNPL
jgi:phage terminase Nu1 subunit (DNA packaging protein)